MPVSVRVSLFSSGCDSTAHGCANPFYDFLVRYKRLVVCPGSWKGAVRTKQAVPGWNSAAEVGAKGGEHVSFRQKVKLPCSSFLHRQFRYFTVALRHGRGRGKGTRGLNQGPKPGDRRQADLETFRGNYQGD